MAPIISVENVSKKYILSHQQQGSYANMREVIVEKCKGMGMALAHVFSSKGLGDLIESSEEFWALKGVSFNIERGDRVGIIGRNGAGKSTLLKILSRITEPTSGKIGINGRVASLLEVGTGFHPELTGRENIYLNGAILGMGRIEINRKFDEIVAFAEVERFLDTPVKRYSSGMYVRLAFAVAAHLEPEILIVDEVLAVGDVQFQKKCMGKMENAGKEGRTILFVSHNMGAVSALCTSAIFLKGGTISAMGKSTEVVSQYLAGEADVAGFKEWEEGFGDDSIRLLRVGLRDKCHQISTTFDIQEDIYVEMEYQILTAIDGIRVGFRLVTSEGTVVLTSEDVDSVPSKTMPARYHCKARIPGNFLNEGGYSLTFASHLPLVKIFFFVENCLHFTVENTGGVGGFTDDKRLGVIRPRLEWETDRVA